MPAPPPFRAAALALALLAPAAPRAGDAWEAGLQLGGGTPGGAGVAVTLTPLVPWARLHAGATWNYYAFGLAGGATFLPLRGFVTPTATVEVGTCFDADLRSPLSGLRLPPAAQPTLSSAGFDYASGMLGIEVGRPGGAATFFLRAGLTRAWAVLRGVDAYPAGSGTVSSSAVHVQAWAPAVGAGLLVRPW